MFWPCFFFVFFEESLCDDFCLLIGISWSFLRWLSAFNMFWDLSVAFQCILSHRKNVFFLVPMYRKVNCCNTSWPVSLLQLINQSLVHVIPVDLRVASTGKRTKYMYKLGQDKWWLDRWRPRRGPKQLLVPGCTGGVCVQSHRYTRMLKVTFSQTLQKQSPKICRIS